MNEKKILKLVGKISKKTKLPVYAVGGYVRDQLLGRPHQNEIDFVVDGSGLAFAEALATEVGEADARLIPFAEFDTARVVFLKRKTTDEGEHEVLFEVEFAGARTESYVTDSRKPKVEATTLGQDLKRRDFTVNAMAQLVMHDGSLGDVNDPFEGHQALKDRKLITPLGPDETFFDDPLRMLRAARFAAQLDFSIDERVLLSMHHNRERIKIVSAERIQEELMKLMATPTPSIGLWLLHGTKVLDQFLPEISDLAGVEEVKGYSHKDNLSHTFAVVDNIAEKSQNPLLRFAGLMHDIAKPQTKKFIRGRGWTFDMHEHLGRKMTKEIMQRLRFSRNDIKYVSHLVRWHLQPIALMDEGVTDSPVRRLMVNLPDTFRDLLILCRADITTGNQYKKERRLKNYDHLEERIREVTEKDEIRAFQSPVRGEEIMNICGLKPGPTVGKIKSEIEEAILEGKIPNEYEAARAYFEKIKDEFVKDAQEWERKVK